MKLNGIAKVLDDRRKKRERIKKKEKKDLERKEIQEVKKAKNARLAISKVVENVYARFMGKKVAPIKISKTIVEVDIDNDQLTTTTTTTETLSTALINFLNYSKHFLGGKTMLTQVQKSPNKPEVGCIEAKSSLINIAGQIEQNLIDLNKLGTSIRTISEKRRQVHASLRFFSVVNRMAATKSRIDGGTYADNMVSFGVKA